MEENTYGIVHHINTVERKLRSIWDWFQEIWNNNAHICYRRLVINVQVQLTFWHWRLLITKKFKKNKKKSEKLLPWLSRPRWHGKNLETKGVTPTPWGSATPPASRPLGTLWQARACTPTCGKELPLVTGWRGLRRTVAAAAAETLRCYLAVRGSDIRMLSILEPGVARPNFTPLSYTRLNSTYLQRRVKYRRSKTQLVHIQSQMRDKHSHSQNKR